MLEENNKMAFVSIKPKEKVKTPDYVYIGHPVTGLSANLNEEEIEQFTLFVENIAILFKNFSYTPLTPAILRSNVEVKNFSELNVYSQCAKAVRISNLFVAVPIIDSVGLGMEMQIAIQNQIPILLIVKKNQKVTSMINRQQLVHKIEYSDYESCISQLQKYLPEHHHRDYFSFYSFEKI